MSDVPYNPELQPQEMNPFRKFFAAESAFMADEGYFKNQDIILFRQYALSYIEQLSRTAKFDAFIPYLAMNYFDRFISRHEVPDFLAGAVAENVNLLLICCLTIAWKMRIKSFSVYRFMKNRTLNYDTKNVLKMEIHILNALDWRMRSLTPMCFAEYFISLLRIRNRHFDRRPVYQNIIRAQADIRFTQFKPSIVAASAVVITSSEQFPGQSEEFLNAISSCEYVAREDLMQCCYYMEMIKKVNEALNAPTTAEASSSAEANEPLKQTGGETSSPRAHGKEPARQREEMQPTMHATGPTTADPLRPEGPIETLEQTSSGARSSRPHGKEPVRERKRTQPRAMEDALMNFELQWTDPMAPKVTITSLVSVLSAARPRFCGPYCKCCPIL